ncbi:MAG: S53 family peptidase [Pseudonocardiaceae bacterium]
MSIDYVPLLGSERRLGKDDVRVGLADPTERITVSVQVRRRPDGSAPPDLAALGAKRPRDRQPVSRATVATSYGSDPADLARVEEFAKQFGLHIEESEPARRTVRLSGTVEQMNKAFGVQLGAYQHVEGTYRGREGHLHVPRHLVGIVERVSGLTNRPLARPHLRTRPRNLSNFPATQIGQLYDFPTNPNGAGVCIGIIELGGGYTQQDLDTYFGALGLATPTIVEVDVDGATNNYGDPADGEVELDIEAAGTIAPGATIAVYFAPNTEQGFIDAITTATFDTQNNPAILSISWGAPEDAGWTAAGLSGMDSAFATAAAAGITVLVAAGDNGSNDRVGDGLAHCDFPASDPYVIACGGTTLNVDDNGTLIGEMVWNDNFGGATGGGISDKFPLPPWQSNIGVPPSVNDGISIGRGVPDVTADADPGTGYDVFVDGQWMVIGGTSAVAPLYAGLLAVIISSVGFNLGFFTPYLYSLNGTNVFVDIDSGTNQVSPAPGYNADPGWDACSGLGRIDGNNLLANV